MQKETRLKQLSVDFEKERIRLAETGVFWRGSLAKRWMTCGNPACRCQTRKNGRHGPYYWWTTKENGRTKAILIPKQFLAEAKSYLKNAEELKKKIRRLSRLSSEIVEIKLEFSKQRKMKNR